jgi:hypothetical protein
VSAYVVGSIAIDLQTAFGRYVGWGTAFAVGREGRKVLREIAGNPKEVRDGEVPGLSAAISNVYERRAVLKVRLLDVSPSLHSEVDRPDSEATFRMALWPPLAVLVFYLGFAVSPWWLLALLVPAALSWQWVVLHREANDALLTAISAKAAEFSRFRPSRPPKPVPQTQAPGSRSEPNDRDPCPAVPHGHDDPKGCGPGTGPTMSRAAARHTTQRSAVVRRRWRRSAAFVPVSWRVDRAQRPRRTTLILGSV